MRIEDLRDVHRAQPFMPFAMHLADGRVLPVPHPEFLAYSPTARPVHYVYEDGRFEVIDVMLIVSLEQLKGRNGRGRRKSA